jgi:hypothetical protein
VIKWQVQCKLRRLYVLELCRFSVDLGRGIHRRLQVDLRLRRHTYSGVSQNKERSFLLSAVELDSGVHSVSLASFCAALLKSEIQRRAVDNRWVYYVAAILLGLAGTLVALRVMFRNPLLWMADADETPDELTDSIVGGIRLRTALLDVATLALVAFVIWPGIAYAVYGWVLRWLV